MYLLINKEFIFKEVPWGSGGHDCLSGKGSWLESWAGHDEFEGVRNYLSTSGTV